MARRRAVAPAPATHHRVGVRRVAVQLSRLERDVCASFGGDPAFNAGPSGARQLARAREVLGESDFESVWQENTADAVQRRLALARALSEGPPATVTEGHRDRAALLTPREREVLDLLAGGLSNKAIARSLGLSVRTVENHLRSVYGKLGVQTRVEAALTAATCAPPSTDLG